MAMNVRFIYFPKISDPRGNLTYLEGDQYVPFTIQRVFWTYDVPGGEIRGGHAYREQHEIIVAISGSLDVVVTDRNGKTENYFLNRSNFGLYLPPLTWRHMENYSTNALTLHLSSLQYSENDYIREFSEYAGV